MEGETSVNKLHTQIEIKPQGQEPPPPSSSIVDNSEMDVQPEGKLPFFKSRYRQRASDTWLISLLVILHLVAFITTTLFNYFSIGSVFFQPLSENPLLGPSASTSVLFTFYLFLILLGFICYCTLNHFSLKRSDDSTFSYNQS